MRTRRGRSSFDDHRARCGIVHDVRGFALLVEDVDRHDDHARFQAAEHERDVLGTIRQVERQAIAGRQAAIGELAGDAVAPGVDLAEREDLVLPFEGALRRAASQ